MDSARRIRHVVLVGLMGSGKTTTGRLIAERLGLPFHDSDAEIEARTGRTVRELRDELGTDAMHELEARALLDALAGQGPDVIAAAASVVDREDCRDALRGEGIGVVWLRVSPAVGTARFGSGAHRPRYGDDPAVFLASQATERDPAFRALGAIEVDTDERDPTAVADTVLAGLRGRGWSA